MKRNFRLMRCLTMVCLCVILAISISAELVQAGSAATRSTKEINQILSTLRREIAEKRHTFTVGNNPAMKYSIQQLCGLVEPPGWQYNAPFAEARLSATALPASFDWRNQNNQNMVTPIKNQGQCGSCWAFGTVAPLESKIKMATGKDVNISEQYLLSCNQNGWDCKIGGWFAHDYHVKNKTVPTGESESGAVLGSAFPYTATDSPCNPPHSHPYKLASWTFVGPSSGVPSVQDIKQAIYDHGPVAASICVGGLFQAYSGKIFTADEASSCGSVNHAIALVGWNDDGGANGGYWILKNSWGTGWGDNGYMYIRYGLSRVGYAANYVELLSSSTVVDLASLINQGNATITLNPANTYVLNAEYWVTRNLTILGNGATITAQGPLNAHTAGITLTVDHCNINATGWGALAGVSGATLIVKNSAISCPGGTGIYMNGGALTVQSGSSITSCWIGVNLANGSFANLHGISVTGCAYAVQAAGATTSVTVDQSSSLSFAGDGTGVGVIGGASAIVRDSTVTGFTNGIDIQPSTPGGTATAVNCSFVNNGASAVSAVSARNVLFSGSRVQGAQHDGVFFHESTGVVENSEVIGSLNTGVTFMGCSNGATIRNCLVKNSAHQGLGIVSSDAGVPSLNVQVLDNTFTGNTVANLFIDAQSTAQLQGNIFSGAPDASIRLHGPQGIVFDSALVTDSYYGFEINGGSNPALLLSSVTEHETNGLLVYDDSYLTAEETSFWLNDLSSTASGWSIFVNDGAVAKARYCSFGPAGNHAFYNNSVTTCDVAFNHWDTSDGPNTPWASGGGSGAYLEWNPSNGAAANYRPFLTQAPVETKVASNLSMVSGRSLNWDSALGVRLGLTARKGSANLVGETAGILRVNDTVHLNLVQPPDSLLGGQMYVVWVSAPLRSNSSSASLKFSVPFQETSVFLQRREIDGTWTLVSGVWDPATHVLTYAPTDAHLVNGTFALTGSISSETVRDLITHFYNVVLGREPEAGAVDAWENGYFDYSLGFGIDVRFIPTEMGRLFFSSDEYVLKRNRSNAQFITDCYRAFLYRAPSAGELNAWLGGVWSRSQAVSIFANSDEFKNYIGSLFPGFNGLPTRNFVTAMYIGFLDRLVDEGGLVYWSGLFDNASDKRLEAVYMAQQNIASQEFQGGLPTNETIVVRLYRGLLGRYPDDNEIAYWSGELNSGRQTINALINQFANSQEFSQILLKYFPAQ
jgi:C1A family cysteine protease